MRNEATPPAALTVQPVAYRSQLASGNYTYCNTPQFFDNAEPLYTTPPAAPVQEILAAFPLFDEQGLDEEKHHCEWTLLQDRKRLHAMLAAPSQYGSPELQAMIVARAIEKDRAAQPAFAHEPVEKDSSNYRLDPPEAEPAQRPFVGLTDEEIEKACVPLGAAMLSFTEVARAIEAKLRSKNG